MAGRANHLSEWTNGALSATRGANATSADAVVKFQHQGRIEILLVEWKYTERYGAPISPDPNGTRRKRYADKVFYPNGPICSDLGLKLEDFFWEPFYQLLRQQMLAWRMEKAREDGAERVRVLHISPADNRALHRITSSAFEAIGGTKHSDAFEAFAAVLKSAKDGAPRFYLAPPSRCSALFLRRRTKGWPRRPGPDICATATPSWRRPEWASPRNYYHFSAQAASVASVIARRQRPGQFRSQIAP